MRLNRRKNRGSRDRRKRPLAGAEKPAAEMPEDDGEERRRELAQAVQSLRSSEATERRDRREARMRRRAERGDRSRRPLRLRVQARKRRLRGGDREAQREALLKAARSVAVDVVGVAREIFRTDGRGRRPVVEQHRARLLSVLYAAVSPALANAGRRCRVLR